MMNTEVGEKLHNRSLKRVCAFLSLYLLFKKDLTLPETLCRHHGTLTSMRQRLEEAEYEVVNKAHGRGTFSSFIANGSKSQVFFQAKVSYIHLKIRMISDLTDI